MRTILKWIGIGLAALLGLAIVAALGVYVASEAALAQIYPRREINVAAATDPAALARGRYLAEHVSVCVDCHGENLGGGIVVDDPALGRIVAPNLTMGQAGQGRELSDADLARVLRTGVKPDGRSALVMPSDDYQHLNDADLAALIAYVRGAAPVDGQPATNEMRALGRFLLATGQLPIKIADRIDPMQPAPAAIPAGVTPEYGHYLANIAGCTGCHGPGLSGGPIPGAPPDWPRAANITVGGVIKGWSEAEFLSTIRTGVDRSGHLLNEEMPWRRYAGMSDDDLRAIWAFLQSMPARESGSR